MVQFYLATLGNFLNKFIDTTSQPGFPKTITGLSLDPLVNEQVVGIDIRPLDGVLYALTRDSSTRGKLYTIEPEAFPLVAPATLVGILRDAAGPLILLDGNEFGFDFDPKNDIIRIVSDLGINIATNPSRGVGLVETPINFNQGIVSILGVAYDNNVPAAPSTTLYDIGQDEGGTPTLYIQNPPESGTLSEVGPLGLFFPLNRAGFDIQTSDTGDNEAFAALGTAPLAQFSIDLYSIDLLTGVALFLGNLSKAEVDALRGFTLIKQQPIPCLHPATQVKCSASHSVRIDSLKGGDIVMDHKGNHVSLIKNAQFESTDTFYKIKKNALGLNQPFKDLLIRGEHPILYKGRLTDAKKLERKLGKEWVEKVKLSEKVPVWSLCTKERTFIMMEGVPVCTWAYHDLLQKKKFKCTFY